jgi:hypothetical protein
MDTHTKTTPPEKPIQSRILLQWEGLIHPEHKRGKAWYAIGGVLIIVLAAYGLITGSWPFTMVMLLIGGIYFLQRDAKGVTKHISIEIDGVRFNDTFTSWVDSEGYWFLSAPDYHELHIMRGPKNGDIIIQTADISPDDIRGVLSPFIPERSDQQESLLDIIIRICKL